MNQLKAMRTSIDMAWSRGFPTHAQEKDEISILHLENMYTIAKEGDFSPSKLGRWLGWVQGVIVCKSDLRLEDMKRINLSFADE